MRACPACVPLSPYKSSGCLIPAGHSIPMLWQPLPNMVSCLYGSCGVVELYPAGLCCVH